MKGCNEEEVLAVLGHELGHWSLSHTLKLLAVSQVFIDRYTSNRLATSFPVQLNLLLSLSMFGFFLEQHDVYSSFGFYDTQPTIIGIILVFQLIFIPYNEVAPLITPPLTHTLITLPIGGAFCYSSGGPQV